MPDIKKLALRVATETHAAQETFDLWNPDIQAGKVQKFIVDFAQRFLAAYLAEQEPVAEVKHDGMVLVPREPTEAMLNAVEKEWHELTAHTFGDFYRAMIVAGEIK